MNVSRLSLILLPLLPASGYAQLSSSDQPPANWACDACKTGSGWEYDVTAGLGFVTDDAYRFGNMTGFDESGTSVVGDLFARYRDDSANYFVADGYLRSTDSFGLFLKGGKQSVYDVHASWQAMPRRLYGSTVSPYSGRNMLTLPADWVRASTTGQMTALGDTARPVEIGGDIDVFKLGVNFQLTSDWDVRVDYSRRERDATTRFGGAFFFNAAELPAPVNYVTDDIEASIGYAAESWHASVSYFGSTFDNSNNSLQWENAYSVPAGTDFGQATLPPDNEAHQVSLAGAILLPARTTLSAMFSTGRMDQDVALLPYTVNASLPAVPLPTNSARGEVETQNFHLRAISSPWRRFTIEGEFRYNDHDNRTPVEFYDYIITDSAPSVVSVASNAYDYERNELKLRGEYRTAFGAALHAGLSTKEVTRGGQDRKRTTTDRAWLRLRQRVAGKTEFNFDFFVEDRDGSSWQVIDNPASQQNPLMRKYNLADRDRSGFRLRASLFSFERLDLAADIELTEDDYSKSTIGLTGSESRRFGFDAGYVFDRTSNAYVSFSREEIEIEQQNSQSFSEPDWSATTKDSFVTTSIGYNRFEAFGAVDLEFEYSWNRGVGKTLNNTSGLQTRFPDLESSQDVLRLGLRYPWSDKLTIGLDYYFEQRDSDDWALDGVDPDTVPTLLAMGADAWNYDTSVIFATVTYQGERR